MGRLGFLFNIEDEDEKKSIVVFANEERISGEVVLGCEYLKVDMTQFFVLDKFHDLAEFYVMDNAKLKFGKISLAQERIVSFDDFVFWFRADDYRIVRELMYIVNVYGDWGVLESELRDRTLRLLKIFERYLVQD